MSDTVIKNALSYALGSDLHETRRETRKKEDGTYESRLKNLKMRLGMQVMVLMKLILLIVLFNSFHRIGNMKI